MSSKDGSGLINESEHLETESCAIKSMRMGELTLTGHCCSNGLLHIAHAVGPIVLLCIGGWHRRYVGRPGEHGPYVGLLQITLSIMALLRRRVGVLHRRWWR